MDLSKKIHSQIPEWAANVFILLSIILIPWTVYLSLSLPTHHLSSHWDVMWGGLDVGIIILLATSGILAYKKSKFIVLSANATASFLLLDAWFDILSERRRFQVIESLVLAIFIEIPLAIICFSVAYRVLAHGQQHH
ncbi:MAG TPA: hypothetical protein VMR18_02430 [Candidatus Saccharimonadales bacterium]|nr:hypothetical protein [Candidatus Saccharimonadales bacterium]